MIICLVLRAGWLIAVLIMEYVGRRDELLRLSWADIRQIALVPAKRVVALSYKSKNHRGAAKLHTLTFRLQPDLYDSFAGALRANVPDRVSRRGIRPWISPSLWILLTVLVILMVLFGSVYLEVSRALLHR
jgi:hypothetical protein